MNSRSCGEGLELTRIKSRADRRLERLQRPAAAPPRVLAGVAERAEPMSSIDLGWFLQALDRPDCLD
jgi:hypothetical protein